MTASRKLLVALLGVAIVAGTAYYAIREGIGPLPDPERCTATAQGHTVDLSINQAENASVIAAVAERRRLPARAISIAIAAAYQESKLENIEHGDRDSLGLFQQRPSQGWGRPEQIMDPYFATNAFYDALVKVHGYQSMPITQAAQAVQRSAFPEAYADHERDGRTIASAMAGYSEAAFSCRVDTAELPAERVRANGLTPRANAVRKDIARSFGELPLGGFQHAVAADGQGRRPPLNGGRAIDVFFRPISAEYTRRGWVLAHYLVANARRLHVDQVIFDGRTWRSGDQSREGWLGYRPPGLTGSESPARLATLEHRDHVHVVVA